MAQLISGFLLLLILFSPAVLHAAGFEIAQEFVEAPGNLTVTPDGRILMSLHQFYNPEVSVVEVLKDGSTVPFPNRSLNSRQDTGKLALDSVLGIHADRNGIVWMLDNGLRSGKTPKLVAWDTRANQLQRVIELPPPAAPKNAFVNDLAVDRTRNHIFISDPAGGSNAALIVVDLQSGNARRVLEGHESVLAEELDLIIDKRPLRVKGPDGRITRPYIGVNPIAEDLDDQWVYYGAMHGRHLYRIRAEHLANPEFTDEALSKRVEHYSSKPVSDGIAIDKRGNIYLGELERHAIGVVKPNRSYTRLARSPKLSWVDSLAVDSKGEVYAVVNRLNLSAPLNAGESLSRPPYYLIRLIQDSNPPTPRPVNLTQLTGEIAGTPRKSGDATRGVPDLFPVADARPSPD